MAEHKPRVSADRAWWWGSCLTCDWTGALRWSRIEASADAALHADTLAREAAPDGR